MASIVPLLNAMNEGFGDSVGSEPLMGVLLLLIAVYIMIKTNMDRGAWAFLGVMILGLLFVMPGISIPPALVLGILAIIGLMVGLGMKEIARSV